VSGRPPRTTPREHGEAKYKREGCRCDECVRAHRTRNARRAYLRATGRPLYVDAAPVRAHIQRLLEHGMTYPQIGGLAGIDRSVVRVAHRGNPGKPPGRRVRAETAAAVLRVQPDPAAIVAGAATNAIGIHRRLEALLADGWTKRALALRLGAASGMLQICRTGRVRAATAAKVVALYDELVDVGGPSSAAARRWRARGYAPPEAWTADTIDDPWSWPAEGGREQSRREQLVEDGQWLVEQGLPVEEAAGRLGVTPDYLQQLLDGTDRGAGAA
jgi:hypothetical protein